MPPNLTEIATTTARHRDKKMTKKAAPKKPDKLVNHQADQRAGIRNTIADAIKSSKKPLKSVKVKFK